jgi:hypothetical protein
MDNKYIFNRYAFAYNYLTCIIIMYIYIINMVYKEILLVFTCGHLYV